MADRTIRLLLVDDHPEARALVRTAVRLRGGFTLVGEAADGAEAVALAAATRPDVVVLDLVLPDLDGQEVLTGIRAACPGAKVVVFSGADRRDRARIAGDVEGSVGKDADLDHLLEVLESVGHRAIASPGLDPPGLDLPGDLASVADARRYVHDTLVAHKAVGLLDDAYIVVSELAANAVLHAHSSYRVEVHVSEAGIRLEVSDSGPGTPEPKRSSVGAESGRGLHLVAAVSRSWGIDSAVDRKTVWAELGRR